VSLNWKEIDLVLEELDLPGCQIQKVVQPDYRRLFLGLFRPGEPFQLICSLEQGATRIHRTRERPRTPRPAPRFMELLRSRLVGGVIESAEHVHRERIVRLSVKHQEELTNLWIRLWGGAGNIIATDQTGTILDAFFRRPRRNEVSGAHYDPLSDIGDTSGSTASARQDKYTVRELPGTGSFNERLDNYYRESLRESRLQSLSEKLERILSEREGWLEVRLRNLKQRREEFSNYNAFKEQGDLILANLHAISPGERWVSLANYERDGARTEIELDPRLSPQENAQRYFERYKKAKNGLDQLEDEIASVMGELARVRNEREHLEEIEKPGELESRLKELQRSRPKEGDRPSPGLVFESHGFRILVGRTARENDELLRRHVRGNDWWLHVRDYPGGYVFVKNKPGKSVPLEVLLDAGNLALHYSKERSSGHGELYYTQVKYLRRAKHGKLGLVIPTQEKNLSVRLDPARVKRLHESREEA